MKIMIEFYSNYRWRTEGCFLFNIIPTLYISNDNGFTFGFGWLLWGFEITKGSKDEQD